MRCVVYEIGIDVRTPASTRTLGALAEKCHAFAKALHYKELEFATNPQSAVEALISINNQLRQPEAAVGVLTIAQRSLAMDLKVSGASAAAGSTAVVLFETLTPKP